MTHEPVNGDEHFDGGCPTCGQRCHYCDVEPPVLWAITATIETDRDVNSQIPTFYLDENAQGIVDEAHAVRIATSIIRATGDYNNFVHVSAVKL